MSLQNVGKYFADDANSLEVPAYTLVNAGIGVDELSFGERLFASGFIGVNNAADTKYIGSVWLNPDVNPRGEAMYIEPGFPRNVVGSLSVGGNF